MLEAVRRTALLALLVALIAAVSIQMSTPSPMAAAAGSSFNVGVATGGNIQFESPSRQSAYLDGVAQLGARWIRFDFTWTSIQPNGPNSYEWKAYDSFVDAASRRGLRVVGTIAYTPQWARDPVCAGTDLMCRPRDPAQFGTFAGAVAEHFASKGVHHWEIWNEPNLASFFRPGPDPAHYTRMLSNAFTAIHQKDPQAVVISGGLSPANTGGSSISPVDFLSRMYAAGGRGSFDALGHHPYCYSGSFDCPRQPAAWSAWTQMASTSVSLRSLMQANGDEAKQIWATEFGAPTNGDRTTVTESQQSAMLTDGIVRFSSYPWAGPLFLYSYQDRGTNTSDRESWFGVVRADGSRKPAWHAVAGVLATGSTPAGTSRSDQSSSSTTTSKPAATKPTTSSLTSAIPRTTTPGGPAAPVARRSTPPPGIASRSVATTSTAKVALSATSTTVPITVPSRASSTAPAPSATTPSSSQKNPPWWRRLWNRVFG